MSLLFNNTSIGSVVFNGATVKNIVFNGTTIFSAQSWQNVTNGNLVSSRTTRASIYAGVYTFKDWIDGSTSDSKYEDIYATVTIYPGSTGSLYYSAGGKSGWIVRFWIDGNTLKYEARSQVVLSFPSLEHGIVIHPQSVTIQSIEQYF